MKSGEGRVSAPAAQIGSWRFPTRFTAIPLWDGCEMNSWLAETVKTYRYGSVRYPALIKDFNHEVIPLIEHFAGHRNRERVAQPRCHDACFRFKNRRPPKAAPRNSNAPVLGSGTET